MIKSIDDIFNHVWKIESITHNGRRAVRGTIVTDNKYNGLVGCKCVFYKKMPIERGKPCRFFLKGHPVHDYWDTSMVLEIWTEDKNHLYIETENSITKFKSCGKIKGNWITTVKSMEYNL